jgi:hypothetical protein
VCEIAEGLSQATSGTFCDAKMSFPETTDACGFSMVSRSPICPGPGSASPAIEPIGLGDGLLLEISRMQEIGSWTGRLVGRQVNVIIR